MRVVKRQLWQSQLAIALLLIAQVMPCAASSSSTSSSSNSSSSSSTSSSSSSSSSQYNDLELAHKALKNHNYKRAYAILHGRACRGCRYSQSILGQMHATGHGARLDLRKAAFWFEKAAMQDFAEAQLALGKLFMGAEKDVVHFEKAEARSLRPNLGKAVFWLKRASAQGLDQAHQLLQEIPGEPKVEYSIAQTRAQAAANASQAEAGAVEGWKGYADVVNTLNQASLNQASLNQASLNQANQK